MKRIINGLISFLLMVSMSCMYELPTYAQEQEQDAPTVVDDTKSFTITFEGNGSTEGSMDPVTVEENTVTNLPQNVFSRENATFAGWNTAADGSGTAYADKSEISLTENVVLYAQWKKAPTYFNCLNTKNGFTLTWGFNANEANDVVSYTLKKQDENGNEKTLIDFTTNSVYTDTDVESGKKYTYSVYANYSDVSSPAVTVSKMYLSEVNVTSITSNASGIEVKWDSVTGATDYSILRNGGGTWKTIAPVSGLSYIDSDIVTGIQYTYYVQAKTTDEQGNAYSSYMDFSNGLNETCVFAPVLTDIKNVEDGIQIQWNAIDAASSYTVLRKTSSTDYQIIASDVTELSYIDTTAKSGTKYTYTIQANGDSFTSLYNEKGKTFVRLSIPEIQAITTASTGLHIEWKATDGAQGYYLYRWNNTTSSWDLIYSGSDLSYTDTEATDSNVIYLYKTEAYYKSYTSYDEYAGSIGAYLNAPKIKSAENKDKGIEVSWNASSNAQYYTIYRKTESSSYEEIATDIMDCSYIDENVISGTKYTYKVQAGNQDSVSAFSSTKAKTRLDTPFISAITNATTGLKITWDTVAGSAGYYVYKWNNSSWEKIATTTSNSYTDTTANENATEYKYYVVAYSGSVKSNTEPEPVGQIRYKAPSLNSCTNKVAGVEIQWNEYTNADSYIVYRKKGSGSFKAIAYDVTGTSYVDPNAISGATYTYSVKAVVNGIVSTYDTTGITIMRLATPDIFSITNETEGLYVQWKPVTGASGYRLYRSIDGQNWNRVTTTKITGYIDTGATDSGVTYYYKVVAYYGSYASDKTYEGVSKLRLSNPVLNSPTNKENGILLTWNPVEGATSYTLMRKGTGSYSVIASGITDCSYFDEGLTSGKKYTYTLIAQSDDGYSSYSTTGKARVHLDIPAITTISNVSGIEMSWNAVTGATGYYVYRLDGDSWTKLCSTKDTTYTDSTAKTQGQTYTYKIRAYYGSSLSDPNGEGTSLIRYGSPELQYCNNDVSGITVRWSAYDGADSYNIIRKKGSNGAYTVIATGVTDTSYFDETAKDGALYTYSVQAVVNGVESSYAQKNAMVIRRLTVPEITDIHNVKSGLKISWNGVTNAACYVVSRWNGSSWTRVTIVESNVYSYIDKEATNSGAYYTYLVQAYNIADFSSSEVSGSTQLRLSTPTIKGFDETSNTVSWDPVAGADGYYVYVKKSSDVDYTSYKVTSGTSKTLSLESGNSYSIKVCAYNGSVLSGFSEPKSTDGKPASPNLSSDTYYGSGNPLSSFKPSCTWYVWGRVKELTGKSLPKTIEYWYGSGYTSTPSTYAIAIYMKGDGYSHVAFVDYYDESKGLIYYSESNNYSFSNEYRYGESVRTLENYQLVASYDGATLVFVPYSVYKNL